MTLLTLFLSFLGFLDATYLTILHYKNAIPPCSLAHGCETVLTSKYAAILGIPIALIGSLFYLLLMGLLILVLQNKSNFVRRAKIMLLVLTLLATIASALLVGIQAFILHAFCQYCLTAEGINTILFILITIAYFSSSSE